ncbi:MAG: TonB-dependent receptor [Betaproteobacteria bacterium]|nr:TonB-dependent receptor [Betaproteobacteria bacterium]
MRNFALRYAVAAALAAFSLIVYRSATAQTAAQAPAAKPAVLPEVSVSATRAERDSMDLPVSIDTIDQRTIREANPQVNLSESLSRVPGIAVLNRQNYAQDLQISSRGFGARSTFGVRGLRLIADGIPATMPDGQGQAATFSLSAAQNIEVLRGPFASLYGNSAGGVVQIFTADGPQAPTVSVSGFYGSYGTWKAGLKYGGQHGPLNMLIDASRFQTDGYRVHSAARRDHLNAKFKYDLGRAGTMTLVVNVLDQPHTRDPLGLTAAQAAQNPRQAGGSAAINALNFNTRKSVAQQQAGLTYDVALWPGGRLNARAYLGERQVTQHLAIPVATQNAATHSGGVVDLDRAYGGVGLRLSHEVTTPGGPLLLSVGLDHDRMQERRRGFINNFGLTGALKRDEDNAVGNTDFYAQADWQINRNLNLLFGARHSRVRFKSTDYFVGAANPDDSGKADFAKTTPALGLTYRVTPVLNVYANVGRGFETPTFAELAYRPGGATGLNFALRPSNSLHRELGVKSLLGDNGRLNVAMFRIDTRDEIVVNSNAGGRSDFKNVPGGTRRKGLEVGWQHQFPFGFEAALSYTKLDASFKQSFTTVAGTPSLPVTVRAGSKLPGIADNIAYGELVWRHAPWGFHAGAAFRHSGKVYVNDQNAAFASAYTIINLRAGLQQRGKGWTLTEYVRVENLRDKAYIGSVIVSEANNRFFEPAPGRNYIVGINAEFSF